MLHRPIAWIVIVAVAAAAAAGIAMQRSGLFDAASDRPDDADGLDTGGAGPPPDDEPRDADASGEGDPGAGPEPAPDPGPDGDGSPSNPGASDSPAVLDQTPRMRFGMDAGSISAQSVVGARPDYGTFWVGAWTLPNGWLVQDAWLERMHQDGITPVVHLYYWGDDISPACIESGCWSELHGQFKDQATWDALTDELIVHLHQTMEGEPVVVVLESEFNKGNVARYEPLDALLADKADALHDGYPNATVVLGFGNWNPDDWGTWDRAVAASDAVGVQGLRASTFDSQSTYGRLYEETVLGVDALQERFDKPVWIQDLAASTYPGDDYLHMQAEELEEFFDGMEHLHAAGVEAIIYRSWLDTPEMSTANLYQGAERHWGLAYASGELKPAGHVWVEGVRAQRGAEPLGATFRVPGNVNEYWVEVDVDADASVDAVAARVEGAVVSLQPTQWGTWATSVHVPDGSAVDFIAAAGDRVTISGTYRWV